MDEIRLVLFDERQREGRSERSPAFRLVLFAGDERLTVGALWPPRERRPGSQVLASGTIEREVDVEALAAALRGHGKAGATKQPAPGPASHSGYGAPPPDDDIPF